ncbi:MAG: TolC family protein [Nitrospirota bacterium]
MRNRLGRVTMPLLIAISLMLSVCTSSHSLTVDEAISSAKETLPSHRAARIRIDSSDALYKASFSPYLPSLDASTSQERHFTSFGEFNTWGYDVTLSYTLWDWGNRKANRNIAGLNLNISQEDFRISLLDLEFNVKSTFYTAIARKETVEQKKIQLQDAEKDYEVAEGRYKFGVAKLSDVLQSSVRLEQARFTLVQAEGDFKKALLELNSLIGRNPDAVYDIQGTLATEVTLPAREQFSQAVLLRPEIKQAEASLKIEENNKALVLSSFFPLLSANASYQKTSGGLSGVAVGQAGITEDKILGFTATWNVFELGKFYRIKSSVLEKDVALERLNDLKRQFVLDVNKAYEDLVTASKNLTVAQEQLKQAQQNYEQAFGEYKVGKGDILSLVQAESFLATAREQLVASRLNLVLSRSLLERAAGVEWLETLHPQGKN